MTFGISGTALTSLAVGGLGFLSARQQASAAQDAANTQSAAAMAGIDEQKRQFDQIQKLLAPYIQGGTNAFGAQQNLLGLNGADAQQQAITGLANSPQMQAMTQQGENAILQNASATGGLRGGNTQAALAQFRPAMLSNMINQQFSNLGSLSGMGQASAAGQAALGQQQGQNVSNLMQQQGAAIAGGQLAQGNMWNGFTNSLMGGLGVYKGLGGKI